MIDLPYTYSTSGRVKDLDIKLELQDDLLKEAKGYQVNDVEGLTRAFKGVVVNAAKRRKRRRQVRKIKRSSADVVSQSFAKYLSVPTLTFTHPDIVERL